MGRSVEIYRDKLMVLDLAADEVQLIQDTAEKFYDLPDGRIALPWNWQNAAWLTAMGYPSVSPIFRDYDFPTPPGWDVMSHQYRIADFCARNRRGYVLAGTGTGKTASLIWATDYLMRIGQAKRVLVICPLSVMSDAWTPTVGKILLGRRSIAELYGDKKRRLKRLAEGTDYCVINFDGIGSIHGELIDAGFDIIIIDESTAIKNRNINRWKLIAPLVKKAVWSWQLTGTPVPQGPDDAYGQLAMYERFGNLRMPFSWWQEITSVKINEFRRRNKPDWQKTVYKYMRPAIRLATRDCVDLPPVTVSTRNVPVTSVQAAAIASLLTHNKVLLDGAEVAAPNQAVVLGKLAQICAGAVFDNDGNVIEVKPSGRLAEVLDIVEQAEAKVIIYAPFRAAVELIAAHLEKAGHKCGIVHGGISKTNRQRIFDAIQQAPKGEMDVLAAVPDAMSHGVTLTEASNVIWYAPTGRTEVYLQANARMERKGQQRHMHITHIWGHPRERDLYNVISGNTAGQLTLMDLYNKIAKGIMD